MVKAMVHKKISKRLQLASVWCRKIICCYIVSNEFGNAIHKLDPYISFEPSQKCVMNTEAFIVGI